MSRTRFDDPVVEHQFRLDSVADETRRGTAIVGVWTLLFVVFAVNDVALLQGRLLLVVMAARTLVVAAGLAAIATLHRSARPALRDHVLLALILAQVLFGVLVNATRSRDLMPPVATNVVAILTVWALLPMPARLQALSALAVTVGTVITVVYLRRPLRGTEAVMVTIELALANAIGATVSLMTHRDRRERWKAVRDMLAAQHELADARVKEVQSQLIQVQRAGGLGSLAVSLAHELGQPLTAVRNNAFAATSYLEREPPDLQGARSALAGAAANAERAGEIIQRMRRYLQRGEIRRERVFLAEVAREALALVAHAAAKRGVSIDVEVPGDAPAVMGDRVQLLQVAVIALVNALDSLEGSPAPGRVRLWAQARDGGVEMGVDDDGPGIPPQVLPKVFDPFFTTKPTGLGMGLPIARTIIEAHGGAISAAPAPGGGTRVAWTVPAVAGASLASRA